MNNEFYTIEAIKKAILRGDIIFQDIQLPSPQIAGTMTQSVIYAKLEAQEIFEKYFRNKL